MSKKKIKPMVRLTKEQLLQKKEFAKNYLQAQNAATGSLVDANANVEIKTVATLAGEYHKDINIQVNRAVMVDRLTEMYGEDVAKTYVDYIESHLMYVHDESAGTPGTPYCVAISMYPLLEQGIRGLGGSSNVPKHLDSFCGIFINMIYSVSAEFAGAVAAVEMLLYFHYFAQKDYGKDYLETHADVIDAKLNQIVYSLNEPCAARGSQSVFWNVSVFDKYFFEALFADMTFPDGTKIVYEEYNKLQKFFMEWFLKERSRALLTFPVLTEASLNECDEAKDKDWADFCADIRSRGLSFFSYNDDNAAALSSCCRLRNNFTLDEDNTKRQEFAYSLGGTGVQTGSVKVMTLNLNRLFQSGYNLYDTVKMMHKFHHAYRTIVQDYIDAKMLPVYDCGFITLNKQYSTIGISGLNEAAEYCGKTVSNNEDYLNWVENTLSTIRDANRESSKELGFKINTELVPGENLGPKNAGWDIADKLETKRPWYNSYIYLPEDDKTSIPDKFMMHGGRIADSLDGGQALHLNLAGLPDKEFFLWLRHLAAKYKCPYWTTNVKSTCCSDCGHIDFHTLDECPKCGSKDLDYATRVIGFCKKLSSFSADRQKEEATRYYH